MQYKLSRLQMGQRNIRKHEAGNATESHDQHPRILLTVSTEAVFGATLEASHHYFHTCSFVKDVAVMFALGGEDWIELPVAEASLGVIRLPLRDTRSLPSSASLQPAGASFLFYFRPAGGSSANQDLHFLETKR